MRSKVVLLFCFLLTLVASTPITASAPPQKPSLSSLSEGFQDLARRVNPSIVQILVTGYGSLGDRSFSGQGFATQRSGGSGVIVDPSGYIVTNAHVVQGARRVQVFLARSKGDSARSSIVRTRGKPLGAQIVGIDRETDLAVLKVNQTGLPNLPLGDSDRLMQGQLVMAFGSPLGLDNSVTLGVISAVARQLEADAPMVYLQTDAPINPGSSGGPLLNLDGEVVGINTFILSQGGGNEGLGFAAPSNIVNHVYNQIKAQGRVKRGIIGVKAQTITPELAAGLGLPQDWGVILGDVSPGGPASQAGLKVGDIVTTLNGKLMENGRQFDVNLYRVNVGGYAELEVLRNGAKQKFRAQVVERADDVERFAEMVTPERNLISELGILALDLTPELSALLPPSRKLGGVIVAGRASDAAGGASLQPGDIILEINKSSVTSLKGLRDSLKRARITDPIVLQVQRGGGLMFVGFVKE